MKIFRFLLNTVLFLSVLGASLSLYATRTAFLSSSILAYSVQNNNSLLTETLDLPMFNVSFTTSDADNTICSGSDITITLVQTGEINPCVYAWNDGTSGPNYTLSNVESSILAGTLYVQVTDSVAGLSERHYFNEDIMVNPVPEITLSSNTSVCLGEATILTVTGDPCVKYEWYEEGQTSPFQISTTSQISFTTPVGNYAYYVKGFNSLGCSSISNTATMQTLEKLTVNIIGADAMCASDVGTSSSLLASSVLGGMASAYQWYKDGVLLPGDTLQTYSASQVGDYQVEVSNGVCSTRSAIHQIMLLPTQEVAIAIDGLVGTTICPNTDYILKVTPQDAQSYVWDEDADLSSAYSNTIVLNSTTAGYHTYFVNVISSDGCSYRQKITLNVENPTNPVISGANFCCFNTPLTLSASTGYTSYSWSKSTDALTWSTVLGANMSLMTTDDLLENTYYRVQALASSGCTVFSSPKLINVLTQIPMSLSVDSYTLCAETSSSYITATVLGGSTYSYQWYQGTRVLPLETSNRLNVCLYNTAGTTQSYHVVVTDALTGCTVTSEAASITTYSKPTLSFKINGGDVLEVCKNETVTLQAFPSVTGGSFLWDAATTNGSTTSLAEATLPTVGDQQIQLQYTTSYGCTYTYSLTLKVRETTVPVITGPSYICEDGGSIELTTVSPLTDVTNYLWESSSDGVSGYTWVGNQATLSVTKMGTYFYRLTVTSSLGCTSVSDPYKVTYSPRPDLVFKANNVALESTTVSICTGSELTIEATGASPVTYSFAWYNESNLLLSSTSSLYLSSPGTSIYHLVLTNNISGCTFTETFYVTLNAPPEIDFLSSESNGFEVCKGNSLTITAQQMGGGGLYTYLWNNGSTENQITVTPTETQVLGTYYVTVTNSSGCSKRFDVPIIMVHPVPAPSISGASSLEEGHSVSLTASPSGADDYIWRNSLGSVVQQGLLNTLDISLSTTESFTVEVVTPQGCSAVSAPFLVSVYGNPVVEIQGDHELCPLWCDGLHDLTLTAVISANAGSTTTYQWYKDDVALLGATSSTLVAGIGTYTVRVFNGVSETTSSPFVVSAKSVPTFSINILGQSDYRVCANETYTLQATPTSADNYTWSSSEPSDIISTLGNTCTISPTVGGSHSITLSTSYLGCTTTLSINLEVNAPAAPIISGNNTVCYGSTSSLTASSGYSDYIWESKTATETVWTICSLDNVAYTTKPVTQSMRYRVSAKNISSGCSVISDPFTVDVYALPVVDLSSNTALICDGEPSKVILQATPGFTSYAWTANTISLPNTGSRIEVSPTSSTSYAVTVEDANGCQNTSNTLLIQVNDKPIFSVPDTVWVCYGEDVYLSAVGSAENSYNWAGGLSTSSSLTLSGVTASQLIDVTATKDGCSTSKSVWVSCIPQLKPQIVTTSASICEDELITLSTTSAFDSYLWEANGTVVSTSSVFTVKPKDYLTSGSSVATFSLSVKNGSCTASTSIDIRVNELPTLTLSGVPTSPLCSGSSVTLTASGADEYSWDGQPYSIQNTYTVAPTSHQVVTVQGRALTSSCLSELKDVTLMVYDAEDPVTVSRSYVNCQVVLTAEAGLSAYQWYKDNVLLPGATTRTYTVLENGTYFVKALRTCMAQSSLMVVDNIDLPELTLTTNDGNLSICSGQSTTLECFVNGSSAYTYLWSGGGISSTQSSVSVTPTTSTTYTVKVIDQTTNCEVTKDISITVFNLTPPTITGNHTLCQGESVRLEAPEGYASYEWSNGKTTRGIDVTSAGIYTVKVTNAEGCEVTSNPFSVSINTLPVVTLPVSSAEICQGETYHLQVNALTGYTYVWLDDLGTLVASDVSPDHTTIYTVEATSPEGCTATAHFTLQVNPLPVVSIKSSTAYIYQGDTSVKLTAICSLPSCAFVWSTGETTQTITIPTATIGTTTYTVTVTSPSGCETTATYTVSVQTKPNVVIKGLKDICLGESLTLSASMSGMSVAYWGWEPGLSLTTAVVNVTPTSIGAITYKALAYNSLGVVLDSSTFVVTVHDVEQATINGAATPNLTLTTCENEAVKLTAQPSGGSYAWSTGEQTQTITIYPKVSDSGSSYTVDVTKNFCTSTASATVQVKVPVLTIYPSTSINNICPGTEITLTASNASTGSSWIWSDDLGTTPSVTFYAPSSTTTYTCTTSVDGCPVTASITLVVSTDLPTITDILGVTHIAKGSSTTLTALGDNVDTWDIVGQGVMSSSANTFIVAPTSTTTYTLTATSASGCTIQRTVVIYVTEYSDLVIIGSHEICQGASTTLSIASPNVALTYYWSNGMTGSSITLNSVLSNQEITVYGVDAFGISTATTAKFLITVFPLPDEDILGDDEICSGDEIMLSAPEAPTGETYSYLWTGPDIQSGQNQRVLTIKPVSSSISNYSVLVTNELGCTKSYTHSVVVHDISASTINGPDNVCYGERVTLKASAGTSWQWLHDGSLTTQEITVDCYATKTYSVNITNAYGCVSTATHTIVVNPLPDDVVISTDQVNDAVCTGQYITLTANTAIAGARYQWSTGESTKSIVVGPASASTVKNYTVTVYSATNCSSSTSKTISVRPEPVATLIGDSPICEGESAVITVTGGFSGYLWSTGATGSPQITVTPATTKQYSVLVTDANGCQVTKTFQVVVNAKPEVDILGDLTICKGGTTTLTATSLGSALSYQWTGDNIVSASSTTQEITVAPTATSTYKCEITFANGCTNSAEVLVTTVDPPTPLINGEQDGHTSICYGESVILGASGGYIDHWSTGETSKRTIEVSPLVTTTYTVWLKNDEDCVASTTFTVQVEALPVAQIDGPSSICVGESVTLTAQGGQTYEWIAGNTSNGAQITVSPLVTTTYTVKAISALGCEDIESKTVTVHPLPTITIQRETLTGNELLSSNYLDVCQGTLLTLVASGGTSYAWSGDAVSSTSKLSIVSNTSGTYTVRVVNANGCVATRTITVNVISAPEPVIYGLSSICAGESVILSAKGGVSYVWSTGETTPDIVVSPDSTTTYFVEAFATGGCSSTVEHRVVVNSLPQPSIVNLSGGKKVCLGSSATLRLENTHDCTYLWSTGETTQQIEVSPTVATTYTCIATNLNGCSETTSITLEINALPEILITPSSDVVCYNGDLSLTASILDGSAASYVWEDGSVGPTLHLTNLKADEQHTVTATSLVTGCVNTKVFFVDVTIPDPPVVTGSSIICAGQSATLEVHASNAVSYLWSHLSMVTKQASISVSPTSTTTYTVLVNYASGCTATTSYTVEVDPLPLASIDGSSVVCSGQQIMLVASGCEPGGYYNWFPGGEHTDTIFVNPHYKTTYSVSAVNTSGCESARVFHDVELHEVPTGTISGSALLCPGDSTTLIINSPDARHFLWNTGDTTQSIVVGSGTYSAIISNKWGCSDTLYHTVEAIPVFDIRISHSYFTHCQGDSVTLSVNGDTALYDFVWSPMSVAQSHNQVVVVTPYATTTYTVTAVNKLNGCQTSTSVTVPVADYGMMTADNTTICEGESVILTLSGGDKFVWINPSFPDSTQSQALVSPLTTTTYEALVYNVDHTCTNHVQMTVKVNPKPKNFTIVGPSITCAEDSVNYVISGDISACTYRWLDNNATGDAHRMAFEGSGYQSVQCEVTTPEGCVNVISYTVLVHPLPEATVTSNVLISCPGDPVVLMVNNVEGCSWQWSDGQTSSSTTVSPRVTTQYSVTVTNAFGCTQVVYYTVEKLPEFVPEITDASGNTPPVAICKGSDLVLQVKGVYSDYQWFVNGAPVTLNGTSQQLVVNTPTAKASYSCGVHNADGCYGLSTPILVDISSKPKGFDFIGRDTVCLNDVVTYTVTSSGVSTGYTYLWPDATGALTYTTSFSVLGRHPLNLTVENAYGCDTIITKQIEVVNYPTPTILANKTGICVGDSVTLTAQAASGKSFSWSTGATTSSITVAPSSSTTYTCNVMNAGGCEAIASYHVLVYADPRPTITGDDIVCTGDDISLSTESSYNTYQWFVNGDSIKDATSYQLGVVDLDTTKTFSVVVSNMSGCQGTTTKTVQVMPLADLYVTSDYTTSADSTVSSICQHYSLNLKAISSLATRYEWAKESSPTVVISTNRILTITVDDPFQVYICRAYNSQDCVTSVSHTVTTRQAKQPSLSAAPDTMVCFGTDVVLRAGNVEPGYFTWSDDLTNSNNPRVVSPPIGETQYIINGTTAATGCVLSDTITIHVIPLPDPEIIGDLVYCLGQSPVVLTARNKVDVPGTTYHYLWSTGDTTSFIEVSPIAKTSYTVTVTNQLGCAVTSAPFEVEVSPQANPILIGNLGVCLGSSTTLTVRDSDLISCLWSDGVTDTIHTFTITTPGDYWVDVTNSAGCVTRKTFALDTFHLPETFVLRPTTGTAQNVCFGDSIGLYADVQGSNFTFKWYVESDPTTIIGTQQTMHYLPLIDQNYYCVITNVNGCQRTSNPYAIHLLKTNDVLSVLSSKDSICAGESVTLKASGVLNGQYHWVLPDGSEFKQASITIAPTKTTEITVWATASDCDCPISVVKKITVFANPNPKITGPLDTVCAGAPVLLTVSGGYRYVWDKNLTTTDTMTVYPMNSTEVYSVTAYNYLDCSARTSFTLKTWPMPTDMIVGDAVIYRGESSTMSISGTSAVSYEWYDDTTYLGQGRTIEVHPDSTTTFTCYAKSKHGCAQKITHTITVIDYVAKIVGPTTTCAGDKVQLYIENGRDDYTYTWSNGAKTDTIYVTPVDNTTYTCVVSTSFGVASKTFFYVSVFPRANVTFDQTVFSCESDLDLYIPYTLTSGSPASFSALFDDASHKAGFLDVLTTSLDVNAAHIVLPTHIEPGSYKAQFYIYTNHDCESGPFDITITIGKSDMLVTKWDDVLVCNDFEHIYVDYEWYKDGRLIDGAKDQFYSELGGFDGDYYVKVRTVAGLSLTSCTRSFHTINPVSMSATPNPVKRNASIRFEIPLSDEELEGAVLTITDMAGRTCYTSSHVTKIQDHIVAYPNGVYLVRINTKDKGSYYVKFIVSE